jgi:O-antigen ligase
MDYEPLKRRGKNEPQAEEDFDAGFPVDPFARKKELPSREQEIFKAPAPANNGVIQKPTTQNAILKRGHALSFAGLYLFVALVYLRPYEWSPSLMFLSTSTFWVAAMTLLIFVLTQLGLENKLTARPREVNLVLLLGLAGLLAVPLALDRLVAWNALLDYWKVILMFIVMVNVVRTERRLRALIWLALISSVVVSVSAVNDYRTGNLLLGLNERIEGTLGNLFQNPNDLALFLNTMIPIAFAMLLGKRALTKKLLYLALVLLFVAGVVCTTSRGGFIGLGCVVTVFAWKMTKKYRIFVGGLALAMILGLGVFGPGGLTTRLMKGSDDASTVTRKDDLKRSLFLMARHPLFGLGMNNYIFYSNSAHATHNAYTQIGAEMGIPALIVYILFLVTPLRRLSKIRRNWDEADDRKHLRYLCLGIETAIVGYMVTSFFLSVAYLWYAYFLVGYAVTLRRLISPAEFESAPSLHRQPSERSLNSSDTPVMARDANW